MDWQEHTFVFIGGLHRSGTTLLARCMAEHPRVSGFAGTGATEDEGQHLQTVYRAANEYGGPGRFGFDPDAHLTETSPLVSDESRRLLVEQWGPHWDMSRPVLVEKSPPNLIRTRFLQALFPGSRMIVVIRHPIAVAGATRQFGRARRTWKRMSYTSLIEHWLRCHELLMEDASQIENLLVMRYEEFVFDPDRRLAEVFQFAGVEPLPSGLEVRGGINEGYFRRWQLARRGPATRHRHRHRGRDARGPGGALRLQPQAAGAPDAAGAGRLMPRERGSANDNYSRLPAPVIAAGRETLTGWRMLTASRRPLPDYLIIGAQRSGTTSLYNYLLAHPQVMPAVPSKGVHYFDMHADRSLRWYRAHFPSEAQRRRRQGADGARAVTGEAQSLLRFSSARAGPGGGGCCLTRA